MNILWAFLIVLILSAILAVSLAFADRKFRIVKDEKLELLEAEMPGANCGGCGFAGCQAYAEAVSKGQAPIGLCSPGGQALSSKMSKIMGLEEVKAKEKQVAFVFCKGNPSVSSYTSNYSGLKDCRAASLVQNGSKACKSGCLGYLSCASVCPSDAISKNSEGDVVVDKEKCIACGKCINVCPNHVIRFIPYSAAYVVACNNKQKGAEVNKVCKVGCIGCAICVNKFPSSGCKMDEFLSYVDYSTDTSQIKEASEACPKKIIRKI